MFLSRGQLDGCYCPTGNLLNKYVRMFIDIDIIIDIKYAAVAVIQRFNLISAVTRWKKIPNTVDRSFLLVAVTRNKTT